MSPTRSEDEVFCWGSILALGRGLLEPLRTQTRASKLEKNCKLNKDLSFASRVL